MDAKKNAAIDDDFNSDLLWGTREIGKFIRRSTSQTSYLIQSCVLDGAVKKLSHKIIIGSKTKLRELVNVREQDQQAKARKRTAAQA